MYAEGKRLSKGRAQCGIPPGKCVEQTKRRLTTGIYGMYLKLG